MLPEWPQHKPASYLAHHCYVQIRTKCTSLHTLQVHTVPSKLAVTSQAKSMLTEQIFLLYYALTVHHQTISLILPVEQMEQGSKALNEAHDKDISNNLSTLLAYPSTFCESTSHLSIYVSSTAAGEQKLTTLIR